MGSIKKWVVGDFAAKDKRLLFYLVILVGIIAWKYWPRRWDPTTRIQTVHYRIDSTATPEQTLKIARLIEILYTGYSNRFATLPSYQPDHLKLKLLLYKDREEFRRINPGLGWAEAFYRKPYCRAYFSQDEVNPHHWMLHEAVHQLNEEVAHLDLAKWLEEGLATYFSTSRMENNRIALGRIDPHTYPVWWLDELATTPDLETNLENGSVIPLRSIVTGRGGPFMRTHFNLYYMHWWSLTHYLFEKDPNQATELLQRGGGLRPFEEWAGSLKDVQAGWHAHARNLKGALNGHDPHFLRTGEVPVHPSAHTP